MNRTFFFVAAAAAASILVVLPGCKPTVRFAVDQTQGSAPHEVQFTENSRTLSVVGDASALFPVNSWVWEFGDGGGSREQEPTYSYRRQGNFDVRLTASNLFGSTTVTEAGLITVTLDAPTAKFTATGKEGDVPLTVEFTDTSEVPAPTIAPIEQWAWDFGDGGTSPEQNPTYTYTEAGTYTVRLTVTTDGGSHERVKEGLIKASLGLPTAKIRANVKQGGMPLTVKFSDISVPGRTKLTKWVWDFGDGAGSEEQHPEYTYHTSGTFTVKLTVTNSVGASTATEEDFITVLGTPTAKFTADPKSGPPPLTTVFTDASLPGDNGIDTWSWDFGDGETGEGANPSHTYNAPGTYDVSLTVSNSLDETDTIVKTGFITVEEVGPTADFSFVVDDANPLRVAFEDTSDEGTQSITAWAWKFGDVGTQTAPNPTFDFPAVGTYSVSLKVTTSADSDTATRDVTLN